MGNESPVIWGEEYVWLGPLWNSSSSGSFKNLNIEIILLELTQGWVKCCHQQGNYQNAQDYQTFSQVPGDYFVTGVRYR